MEPRGASSESQQPRKGKKTLIPPPVNSSGLLKIEAWETEAPLGKVGDLFQNPTCVLSHFSRVWLFATLWTLALLAPLSMGFSSQEYSSGLPFPPSGDLPKPGIKPTYVMSPALADRFFTICAIREAPLLWEPLSLGIKRKLLNTVIMHCLYINILLLVVRNK